MFNALTLSLALVLGAQPAARTWYEQAEASLTCTALATDVERRSLGAPVVADPRAAAAFAGYFKSTPRDERQARFRHLATLAAIGWWADKVNDQTVRGEAYLNIAVLAEQYAATGGADPLFRHVASCARAQLLSSALERGDVRVVDQLATALFTRYQGGLPAQPVLDWPLLLALRELRLEPKARGSIARLATRAVELAGDAIKASQPERASRLLAAAGAATFAAGEAATGRELMLRSLAVTGSPPTVEARWRAFPVLFDAQLRLTGAADAAKLAALVDPAAVPGSVDQRTAFDALLRHSIAAEARGDYQAMGQRQLAAFRALAAGAGLETPSLLFYRNAFDQLLDRRNTDVGTVARANPAQGASFVTSYLGTVETQVGQAQTEFVADVRSRLIAQHKADNSLFALSELAAARPADRARITDATFRLAQVRSFGRLTLAAVTAEARRANRPEAATGDIERFFSMATQNGTWLHAFLRPVRLVPGEPLPDGETLWRAIFAMDVFQNETTRAFGSYLATVRRAVPATGPLLTPAALPIGEFRRRLRPDEALIATQVTSREIFLWVITPSSATLVRQPVLETDLLDRITRLRASLTPSGGAGAPRLAAFDAAAAHDLYQWTIGAVADQLSGVRTVVWYGNGPLGAIPPGVLVDKAPAKPAAATPADFGALSFLVDRFAFAVIPDLSLFAPFRDRPAVTRQASAFLGIGAPLLAAEEIEGTRRARAYDLAGGMDGKALAELPKLEESVDEMKSLAELFGASRSTLWLGPAADEKQLAAADLSGYGAIAFATHGFLADEVAGVREPSLMLVLRPDAPDRFDGILTASEIADLRLGPGLVILSACNTAAADGRPRADTFTGLTQAFFTAGARSVMVSHWPVMSGAAVQLSVGTVDGAVKGGESLARSLQLAIQRVRKDAGNPIEAHPSYWGPFVIVGDGR